MDTTVVPHRVTLRSGHRVLVRAVRPDDGPGLAEAYDQLSQTSRYRRLFHRQPPPTHHSPAYLPPLHPRAPQNPAAVVPPAPPPLGGGPDIPSPRPPAPG